MPYPGGKSGSGVYQTIINQLPPHEVYIEPFLGGAAILRAKKPARFNIGLDLDASVIAAARAEFSADTSTSGGASDRRRRAPEMASGDGDRITPETAAGSGDVDARRFRRRDPLSPKVAGPPARPGANVRNGAAAAAQTAGLAAYEFRVGDAIEFLRAFAWTGRELVYCDPPYVHETRSRARLYRFEMTNAQHVELLRTLKRIPAPVVLSGYFTQLYDRSLKGWRSLTFQTTNRAGQLTTEWLWMNYPEPVALHDYRYVGSGHRERWRINKRRRRWVERLRRMPLLEARALLAAIDESGLRGAWLDDSTVRS